MNTGSTSAAIESYIMDQLPTPIREYNRRFVRRLAKNTQADSVGSCYISTRTDANGRARINYGGKARYASRVLLSLICPPPTPTSLALHSCDNPACVNPKHLRWGTYKDNACDREARRPGGGRKRVSPEQVKLIHALYASGHTQQQIGARLGISQVSVCRRINKHRNKIQAIPAKIAHDISQLVRNFNPALSPPSKTAQRDYVINSAHTALLSRVKKQNLPLDPTWRDYQVFAGYIGIRPSPKHSLYRQVKALGYVPGNVRWATSEEQNNNRSNNQK